MHTVTIRGSIKLLGPSAVVSGATETKFHIDAVNIIPLNRQVGIRKSNLQEELLKIQIFLIISNKLDLSYPQIRKVT